MSRAKPYAQLVTRGRPRGQRHTRLVALVTEHERDVIRAHTTRTGETLAELLLASVAAHDDHDPKGGK